MDCGAIGEISQGQCRKDTSDTVSVHSRYRTIGEGKAYGGRKHIYLPFMF
jgi:hypothetical protein